MKGKPNTTSQFDVFLSHGSIDKPWVTQLKDDLARYGLQAWLDKDEIRPGNIIVSELELALENSRAVALIVSPEAIDSGWVEEEYSRAVALAQDKHVRLQLIPIILRTAKLPGILKNRKWVDFRDETAYTEKVEELVWGITGEKPALEKELKQEHQKPGPGTEPDQRSPFVQETQYLNDLIENLQRYQGILEYVELSARANKMLYKQLDRGRKVLLGSVASVYNTGNGHTQLGQALDGIEEALSQFPRFVIIGEPGAGKTTTLVRLAREAARKRLEDPDSTPVPIFLPLSSWPDDQTPAEFVSAAWRLEGSPLAALKSGAAFLYLDGLDEMGAKGKEKAKQLDQWLIDDNVKHVIVTCRENNFRGNLQLDLPIVLLEALNHEQVREFAENYLGDKADDFLKQVSIEDETDPEDDYSLIKLTRNPYLLTALIIVYDNSKGGELPYYTSELFGRLVNALWEREREKHPPGAVPPFEEIVGDFARLAYAMIDEDQPREVPYDWVRHQLLDLSWANPIDEEKKKRIAAWLQVARNAHLIEFPDDDRVRFYHELVKEYFAAEGLRRARSWEKLKSLPGIYIDFDVQEDGTLTPYYGRYIGKWDQVVIALCGVSKADTIVRNILDFDPHLAARCIASGVRISDSVRQEAIDRIIDVLHRPDFEAGAWTGVDILPQLVEELMQSYEEPEKSRIMAVLPTERQWIRDIAAETLAYLGKDAVPVLQEALRQPDEDARIVAFQALMYIGAPAVPGVLNLLKDENDESVRAYALETLRIIREDFPDLFKKLLQDKQQAIGAEPNNSELYIEQGNLYYISDKKREALGSYQHAAILSPENLFLHFIVGDLYLELKQHNDAAAAYERAIKLEPENPTPHLRLIWLYIDQRDLDKVLAVYKHAVELSVESIELHAAIEGNLDALERRSGETAEAYNPLERYEKILADLNHIIELHPDNLTAYMARVRIYSHMGRTGEALDNINHILERQADSVEHLYVRAQIYEYMERYEEAYVDLYIARATIYYLELCLEDNPRVMADFNWAVELAPENPWVLAERGRYFYHLKQYDRALVDLNQAIYLRL
jgi:tetratricopeptide (TPR) repeat protein